MVSFFSKAWFLCDRPDLPTGTIGTIMWKPGLIETNFGLYSNSLRTARPEIHLLFSGYHNSNYSYKEIPCARSTGTFAHSALQPLSTPIYFFSYISTKERRCFFFFLYWKNKLRANCDFLYDHEVASYQHGNKYTGLFVIHWTSIGSIKA